jgi:hypothetical protein
VIYYIRLFLPSFEEKLFAMVRTETGTKKKPPTFQHLPANRGSFYCSLCPWGGLTGPCTIAKKLKKDWVDIKKIKNKWRTEKRKEGFVGGSASIKQGDRRNDDIREEGSSEHPNEVDEAHDEGRVLTPPKQSSARAHSRAEQILEKQKEDPVRDMTREAYSRASLHTYKSDPLHRNRSRGGSSRGDGVTIRTAGGRGRGRGQPNMKLRMGAMLEKIKRDYS